MLFAIFVQPCFAAKEQPMFIATVKTGLYDGPKLENPGIFKKYGDTADLAYENLKRVFIRKGFEVERYDPEGVEV